MKRVFNNVIFIGNVPIIGSEPCTKLHAESHRHLNESSTMRTHSEISLWDPYDLVNQRTVGRDSNDYGILVYLVGPEDATSMYSQGFFSSNYPSIIGPLPDKRLVIDGGERIPHAHSIRSLESLGEIFQKFDIGYHYYDRGDHFSTGKVAKWAENGKNNHYIIL